LPGTHYWNQALQVDNFTVEAPGRYCGDPATVYHDADITGPMGIRDCYVDRYDLAELAGNWLDCTDPADPCNCDPLGGWVWLGNDLGKDDIVPPPWTAITVSGGDTVNIWGRSYTFDSIGLPDSLMTVGDDLLYEPVRFVTVVNGSPVTFSAAGPLTITPGDAKTVVEGSSTAGDLQLRVVTTVEFDGFARVDLTLTDTAGASTLNKFWLEVPVTEDNALFHLPLFINDPTIPPEGVRRPILGEDDWQVTHTTTKLWWIGGNDRGLILTAEDDRNWCPADRDEAQELDPETGRVIWRYHFVDDAVTRSMATPLEITYCFMATPVKPVDDWYAERNSGNCGYGIDPVLAASAGIKHGHIHEPWTEIMGYPGTFEHETDVKSHISDFSDNGIGICLYSHPVISSAAPEWRDWIELWSTCSPPRAAFTRDPTWGGMLLQSVYPAHQSESWADFYIYNWVKMINEWGANGVYLDGTFLPRVTTNPNFEHAYIVGEEVRPTRAIFAAREFMKRWYIACKTADPNFYFLGHLSGYFMPTASFLDFCVGGEQLSYLPTNSELSWAHWQAEDTGRQFGLVREFYPTTKFQEPYVLSLALVHGISIWGSDCGAAGLIQAWQKPVWDTWDAFGINDATWVPYWRNSTLVTSSHPDVKVSYYTKPEQILLVAATNKRTKPSATVTVDLVGLGLDPGNISATFGFGGSVDLSPYIFGAVLSLPFPSLLVNDIGYVNYLWIRSDL